MRTRSGMRTMAITAAAGLTVMAACQSATGASGAVRLRVDAAVFALPVGDSANVSFTVTNVGDRTVYVARCGSNIETALERASGDGWEDAAAAGCLAIYPMSPLALEPGASAGGSAFVPVAGRFRLRAGTATDGSGPARWRTTSPAFSVR